MTPRRRAVAAARGLAPAAALALAHGLALTRLHGVPLDPHDAALQLAKLAAQVVLAVAAAARWAEGPRRARAAALALLAAASVASTTYFGRTELGNLPAPLGPALAASLGLAVPAAALVADRFRGAVQRPRRRLAAAVGVAAAVYAGLRVRPGEYPVAHAAAFFALLVAAARWSVPPPCLRPATRRRVVAAALVILALPSSAAVRVAIHRDPGAVLPRALGAAADHLVRAARARILDVDPKRYGLDPALFTPRPDARDRPTGPPLVRDLVVLLVVVDSLRADVLDDPEVLARLPTLTALRRRSVVFTNARSTASSTTPAMVSVHLGRTYSQVRWRKVPFKHKYKYFPVDDDGPRLSEILAARGVATESVTPGGGFRGTYGTTRGFAVEHVPGSRAFQIGPAAVQALEHAPEGPAFYYVHFLDPHAPYRGPRSVSPFARYVGEIEAVDAALGTMLDTLRRRGLDRRTVVVLTADHGEAFGEHGTYGHAATVYEELVRIPLWIHHPAFAPRRIDDPVSLLDLAPTILDLFGAPIPGPWLGTSLRPTLEGDRVRRNRPIPLDAGRRIWALVFPDRVKAILDLHRGTEEVYDLARDPGEQRNLADTEDGRRRLFLVERFFSVHAYRAPGYTTPYRP